MTIPTRHYLLTVLKQLDICEIWSRLDRVCPHIKFSNYQHERLHNPVKDSLPFSLFHLHWDTLQTLLPSHVLFQI